MEPDFQSNGAPVSKPSVPFADPFKPNFKPNGFPPGMSPPPKTEIAPINNPAGSPGNLNKPTAPTGRGVRGDDFGKRPLTKPPNLPTTRTPNAGPIAPTVPFLIRKIIEYVLEPQPTSDGTPPDFEEVAPEDEPYPDTNNEPELETRECLELVKYPQLEGDKNSSLIQLDYLVTPGHVQGNFNSNAVPDLVLRQRKTYKKERLLTLDSSNREFKEEFRKIGKFTSPANQPPQYVTYKVAIRVGFRRDGDGLFVWGGWSIYLLGPYALAGHTGMPNPILVGDSAIKKLQYQGARYLTRFGREAYPCSPQPEKDTQDPNDYDRNQDEDAMPCKWQPSNDPRVESLALENYSHVRFIDCEVVDGISQPYFGTENIDLPICVGPALIKILDEIAYLKGRKCSTAGSSFWNIKKGNQTTLYAGIPNIAGVEVALPLGCVNAAITFDNAAAKSDKSLRDLKRIGNVNASNQTFVNTMRVWLIDADGNAITEESLWVPSTLISIPFRYRAEICKIRMMPKSMTVTFTVVDTGDRWEAKSMPT